MVTRPLLQVTILTPDLPPGAGEHRHGAICFCGRGVHPLLGRCHACGYLLPRERRRLAHEAGLERLLAADEQELADMLDASMTGGEEWMR